MTHCQELFNQYIDKMRNNLFMDTTLEDLFGSIASNHRVKRFVALYLLKDKETFHGYFMKRHEFGLEGVFNQTISALYFESEKLVIKNMFISELSISKAMMSSPATIVEAKETTKDLQAFVWYATKEILLSPVS
ncbi:hypothetical protein ACFVS2_20270 [Brevibacillus sp. NPDC058079]|uniref:hypothetical protein n=1 Tax=Brevibacillus sp. NPDC058079 TaxID=3346330 RepID=UPI0036E6F4D1